MKDDDGSSRLRRSGKADGPLALVLALGIALTTVMALALVSVETTSAQPATCGNGTVDGSEECDPSSPSGATCLPNQVCVSCDCTTCGNGTLDGGEECDASAPNGSAACTPTEACSPGCACVSVTTTTLVNHFQCYEIRRRSQAVIPGVTVEDQFGSSTVSLTKVDRLCAPTNKENEDPGADDDPGHLKAWQDKHNRPRSENHEVVNQFGTLRLDVTRPMFLLVPAAKSLTTTPPPPLAAPTPDHFQCYKVKRSRGGPKFTKIVGVDAEDQFGTYRVDLLRPKYLCAPANKNGEDPTAPAHPEHLLCYKTRNQTPFGQRDVTTTDQFGSQTNRLIKRWELCVPSLKDPSAPTTTTTTVVVTTSTSSSTAVVPTTTLATTSTVVTTTTTSSTTTTTVVYGSPGHAFVEPVRSLLE